MKMDSQEMTTVVAADAAAQRVDLYVGIHKAMRALMADLLVMVGRMDPADDAEVARTVARVLQFAEFCTAHLTHENEFVHVAMEARQAGSSTSIATEHVEHEEAIARLKRAASSLPACQGVQREREALDLYRQLALFVAHNFEHMHIEETTNNQVLWTHYSDAELLALHARLVASLPPQENLFVLRWMIPAMTPGERLQVLQDMQAHAPAPAFAAALETAQAHLDPRAWAALARGLGLAPVPGLVTA